MSNWSRSRRGQRPGLTLVETLAAVALLAAISGACATAFRDLRATSNESAAHQRVSGLAHLVAEALVKQPSRFGLNDLADLAESPRALTPDPELDAAMREIRCAGGSPGQDQAANSITARTLRSGPSANLSNSAPTRARRAPAPHWLIVEVDGDVAVRCVLIAEEPAP